MLSPSADLDALDEPEPEKGVVYYRKPAGICTTSNCGSQPGTTTSTQPVRETFEESRDGITVNLERFLNAPFMLTIRIHSQDKAIFMAEQVLRASHQGS